MDILLLNPTFSLTNYLMELRRFNPFFYLKLKQKTCFQGLFGWESDKLAFFEVFDKNIEQVSQAHEQDQTWTR